MATNDGVVRSEPGAGIQRGAHRNPKTPREKVENLRTLIGELKQEAIPLGDHELVVFLKRLEREFLTFPQA